MNSAIKKQSWLKTAMQRLSVIFGPKRLSLASAKPDLSEDLNTIPEDFSFENMVSSYNNYTLKQNKVALDKETNEEITDSKVMKKIEFANLWRKCASGNLADESDDVALSVCFSEEAKETYNKITKLSITHLIKYGHIDTKEILDVTKEMPYKWSRQTARKLFKNAAQAKLVTEYYRLATPNAKEQTTKTLTTDEALYG